MLELKGALIGAGITFAAGVGVGWKFCDNAWKAAQLDALQERDAIVKTVENVTDAIESEVVNNESNLNEVERGVYREIIKYRDGGDCPLTERWLCLADSSLQDTPSSCDSHGATPGAVTHEEALFTITGNNLGHRTCLNRYHALQAYVREIQSLSE